LIDQRVIIGRIVSHTGVSPGPAKDITYTIETTLPDGGIVKLADQTPGEDREHNVDVVAVPVGRSVLGVLTQGWESSAVAYVQWMFSERVYWGECGTEPAPPVEDPDYPHLTNEQTSTGTLAGGSIPQTPDFGGPAV